MRFGVNLFGTYKNMLEDRDAFFQNLADAGYCYVEPCFTFGDKMEAYPQFLTLDELANYVESYEKAGLQVFSSHVMVPELDGAAEKFLMLKEKYGYTNFIINHGYDLTLEGCSAYAESLKNMAKELLSSDIHLILHNGPEEVRAQIDGISAYEWLLQACDGLILAQPDTGWIIAGGGDPESFLWRNRSIIHSVHYKDVKKLEDGSIVETPVGTGLTDMEACFQFARAMEVPQFIDQDNSDDMIADVRRVSGLFRSLSQCRPNTSSTLCVFDTETGTVTELQKYDKIIEAPNWLKDSDTLIYNSDGLIYKYEISTGTETQIPTGNCTNCNNDHVLSPEHTQLAVSHSASGWMSQIYILPIEGGEPELITPNAPSYLHGWSPDGKELAYCAFRMHDEEMAVDIYTIPAEGGEETQLTSECAFNDGPEYSPDGKYIWFNSTRTGLMQIWRMNCDGTDQTQMTFENANNWFAHISPDGQKVVNLAYSKQGLSANEHLPNMNVELWMMNTDGTDRKKILSFFGGQGSINVNSWASDSKRFAFVKYELIHK